MGDAPRRALVLPRAVVEVTGVTKRFGQLTALEPNYEDAAELAFHAAEQPTVFALNVGGRHNQYDLWRSFPDTAHAGDGLVVALDTGSVGAAVARALAPCFAATVPGTRVALTRGADTVAVRQLWRFTGWRGSWPARSPGGR